MDEERPDYLSYLLRLWRTDVKVNEEAVWRASLENPSTGERRGFASLDELFDFLRRQTGAMSDENADRTDVED